MLPTFLELPPRPGKPRATGMTHVLDNGIDLQTVTGVLDAAADYLDVWKLGWGTAYVDPTLSEKLTLIADHDVRTCLGGTMLEVAWAQGKASECLAWAHDVGFASVEVSRGVAAMEVSEKHDLIRRAARSFAVFSEVGRKDSQEELSSRQWTDEIIGDRAAGAQWVIAEGRESGSVGVYRADGSVRTDVVAAISRAGGIESILFETPQKDQQAWFIHEFGPNVNLANVAASDAIALETLRVGLRADTFGLSRQWLPI
ncbi:phosphosulfolactate synthase [Leekyejoonella antrihumi]|nr:phosphosulfolactate synthase [Leekyejoonella antrihumi]